MLAQFQVLHMQFLAATVLGISNTIAGWLSHDYVHGRGKWADLMRPFGHICGGMSPTWWSDKHNVHHARTNEVYIYIYIHIYICTYTFAYTHIHEHIATDKLNKMLTKPTPLPKSMPQTKPMPQTNPLSR